jgi:nucleoside-diphosphate-sugar epimerase
MEKLFFLKKADVVINCVGKIPGKSNNFEEINFFFVKKLINEILKIKRPIRFVQLSSVSIFGANKKYLLKKISITENFPQAPNDSYASSKLRADLFIRKIVKKNNKYFSYTILRITNVFGLKNDSNLLLLFKFFLKYGLKFNYSSQVVCNFIHVKDVAKAVLLTLLKLNVSKNKIYIVSNDQLYFELYKIRSNINKLINIPIPKIFFKFIFFLFSYKSKIAKFFFTISSEISYSNKKIKKELGFNPKFSIKDFF